MKIIKLALAALLLPSFTACAIMPSWQFQSFQKIKECRYDGLDLEFFVRNSSGKYYTDMFKKEITVKVETSDATYGKVLIWLYYPEIKPNESDRFLSIPIPEKAHIQTIYPLVNYHLNKKAKFFELWRKYGSENRLDQINDCIYGDPRL